MKNNWKTGIIGFCLGVLVVAGTAVFAAQMEVVENPFPIKLDGQEITLEGYNLNDNTYFKLRDIGEKVGFEVDFKDDTILMTSKTEAPDESSDTAKELAEQGVFGGESTVRDVYRRGGKSERFGVGKMIRWWEVRPCPVKPYKRRGPNRRPEEKPELCKPCKIPNPTPLQLDVHDLCLYNRKARKQGKPELSYGVWAAKGKPGRP